MTLAEMLFSCGLCALICLWLGFVAGYAARHCAGRWRRDGER